jgi:uncharacterized protein YjiS (DUF1127 family)
LQQDIPLTRYEETTMTTTTLAKPDYSDRPIKALAEIIRSPVAMLQAINTFHQRSRDRARFVRLNDHLLDDIGLTREEAHEEVGKPYLQDKPISQKQSFWHILPG